MIRVGGGGNFEIPKSPRKVVGDCVGGSVRPAGAGKGMVGRGGSDGVVEMGVSSGEATIGRRTGKGGGAGEELEGDALGDVPDADEGRLTGASRGRGGGRGGREYFGGTRLPSLSLDAMLGSREMGCRGCFGGSLSSVGYAPATSLRFSMRPDGGSLILAGRGGTAGLN